MSEHNPTEERPANQLSRMERMQKAGEKFNAVGPLGVTAQDHLDLGSTPTAEMLAQPDTRLVDLMDDDQLLAWLNDKKDGIVEFRRQTDSSFAQSSADIWEKQLALSIAFLKSIGRLPAGFQE